MTRGLYSNCLREIRASRCRPGRSPSRSRRASSRPIGRPPGGVGSASVNGTTARRRRAPLCVALQSEGDRGLSGRDRSTSAEEAEGKRGVSPAFQEISDGRPSHWREDDDCPSDANRAEETQPRRMWLAVFTFSSPCFDRWALRCSEPPDREGRRTAAAARSATFGSRKPLGAAARESEWKARSLRGRRRSPRRLFDPQDSSRCRTDDARAPVRPHICPSGWSGFRSSYRPRHRRDARRPEASYITARTSDKPCGDPPRGRAPARATCTHRAHDRSWRGASASIVGAFVRPRPRTPRHARQAEVEDLHVAVFRRRVPGSSPDGRFAVARRREPGSDLAEADGFPAVERRARSLARSVSPSRFRDERCR